jgi:predicted AlkP superfamily phosphohydrolase/phosphomutase
MKGKKIMNNNQSKVFVIGLDGATFDIIDPLIKQGELPNIQHLVQRGARANLESTIPPLSPVAWTSFMTGKNPGKHGVFDFFGRRTDNYNLEFYNATSRGESPIWTLFSEAGKKVGVVNVPMTYPPDKVNGEMISGMDTPLYNSKFAHPPEIISELQRNIGGYLIEKTTSGLDRDLANGPEAYIEEIHELIENRFNTTRYLMQKYDWDLFVIVFEATDRLQHFFWKYMDQNHPEYVADQKNPFEDLIYDAYKKVDQKIGMLINGLDEDTTVVVLSDHGFGPICRSFRLNLWLSKKGYLSYREGFDVWNQEKRQSPLKRGILLRTKNLLKKSPVFKKVIKSNIDLIPNVDWSQTKSYSIGGFGNIYINLKGREPSGIVEPGKEYEDLRKELMGELMGIKDPENGKKVIKEVYKREDVYTGKFLERAPDILITWSDGYSCIGEREQIPPGIKTVNNELFSTHKWSGNHISPGILVIKGKDIKKNHHIENSDIIDIAPTILYLAGVDIPNDMDGKVIVDAINDDFLRANPFKYYKSILDKTQREEKEAYSEEEAEKVKDRLRGLGYLDEGI